jgi:hypothetical protein
MALRWRDCAAAVLVVLAACQRGSKDQAPPSREAGPRGGILLSDGTVIATCESARRGGVNRQPIIQVVPGDGIGKTCLGDPVDRLCQNHLGWCDYGPGKKVLVVNDRKRAISISDPKMIIEAPGGLRIGMPESELPYAALGPVLGRGMMAPETKVLEFRGLRLELKEEGNDWKVASIIVH